jgi:hypothetical protein
MAHALFIYKFILHYNAMIVKLFNNHRADARAAPDGSEEAGHLP